MIYRNGCVRLADALVTLATVLAMMLPAGSALAQEDEELIEEWLSELRGRKVKRLVSEVRGAGDGVGILQRLP